jgi:hypothetical protein
MLNMAYPKILLLCRMLVCQYQPKEVIIIARPVNQEWLIPLFHRMFHHMFISLLMIFLLPYRHIIWNLMLKM